MIIISGTMQYQLGTAPVIGRRVSYNATELKFALSGTEADVVFDNSGKANIQSLLAGLVEIDLDTLGGTL